MGNKDKDRLYLAMDHRYSAPGYHWSLLYAPKDKKKAARDTTVVDDCVRFDLTNQHQEHGLRVGPWWYRKSDVNQFQNASLIARIMLAKFDSSSRNEVIARLHALLERVTFTQEPAQTCRVWALDAIAVLEQNGLVKLKVKTRQEIQQRAIEFADHQMREMAARRLVIEDVADIPVSDFRE
ncbi:hypothetical protein B0H15DRAFT_913911 [Mycena belliarum]|uniref:Uncharacterized protein n=1 Tax=Mycena belliarum TaxID=1033014 RepID=A0AAD6TUA4_9AGAR|nr:hypothetical protein B0H15DRAFT_913911 [Mycena belliae]